MIEEKESLLKNDKKDTKRVKKILYGVFGTVLCFSIVCALTLYKPANFRLQEAPSVDVADPEETPVSSVWEPTDPVAIQIDPVGGTYPMCYDLNMLDGEVTLVNNWVTPCQCGASVCVLDYPMCMIGQGGINVCSKRCKGNGDCPGTFVCGDVRTEPPYKGFGRCLDAGKQPADFRKAAAWPPAGGLKAPAATNARYEELMNLEVDTAAKAKGLAVNSAAIFVWSQHYNNPGHASMMIRRPKDAAVAKDTGVFYISHWPRSLNGDSTEHDSILRASPREELPSYNIQGEHKLPDVIIEIQNLNIAQAKLDAAVRTVADSGYQFLRHNCAWGVKAVLEAIGINMGRRVKPWTPWAVEKKIEALAAADAAFAAQTTILWRPDMTMIEYNSQWNRNTDPIVMAALSINPSKKGKGR